MDFFGSRVVKLGNNRTVEGNLRLAAELTGKGQTAFVEVIVGAGERRLCQQSSGRPDGVVFLRCGFSVGMELESWLALHQG